MLSRPQEVQPDHISRPRLVSSSHCQVGDLKDNFCLIGRTRLPGSGGWGSYIPLLVLVLVLYSIYYKV